MPRITMMFDPKSYDLRQWTITDAQGKDTTVMIFNVKQGVKIDQALFKIDYKRNCRNSTSRRQQPLTAAPLLARRGDDAALAAL